MDSGFVVTKLALTFRDYAIAAARVTYYRALWGPPTSSIGTSIVAWTDSSTTIFIGVLSHVGRFLEVSNVEPARSQSNHRMKLTGRGHRFAWRPARPPNARDKLAERAASLQLMRGR
jgi:hypothetical protein